MNGWFRIEFRDRPSGSKRASSWSSLVVSNTDLWPKRKFTSSDRARSTLNTGDVRDERTVDQLEWLSMINVLRLWLRQP